MNDKMEFDITYAAPKGYQVISNGKMVSKRESSGYNLWEFNMNHPMPSYLVAVVIGNYDKVIEYSESGIPLEMYYYPEDSLKVEPTYRYTKQLFDFLVACSITHKDNVRESSWCNLSWTWCCHQ